MRKAAIVAAALLCAAAANAPAATYEVGPGKPYSSLGDVENLLSPGDLVLLHGDHAGGVQLTRSGTAAAPITIRGVTENSNRATISGGVNTLEIYADHHVVENLELTGGSFRCFYHHGHEIVLRDSEIHHCPAHGILGADTESGSLLAERLDVHHSGNGTSQHAIYMATDESDNPGAVFRLRDSWLHDNTGGNNVKSRAERNEIHFNWIEGTPETFHELELIGPDPAGGVAVAGVREDSDVVGNVLLHDDPNADFSFIVRFGGDATGESNGRYRFVNNTMLGARRPFRAFDAVESAEMHNNVIFNSVAPIERVIDESSADWATSPRAVSGSRNWVMQGAGLLPPEWTETSSGSDPGFANAAGFDFRPAAGSPLVGAGSNAPASQAEHEFPGPLFPPGFEPPRRTVLASGATAPRSQDGAIDIGAYELGSPEPGAGAGGPVGGGPGGGSGAADTTPPRITRLRILRTRRGWYLRFTLSERAHVGGRLERRRSGRRPKRVRSLRRRELRAGTHRVRLGRLARGGYQVRLSLTDTAGNRGKRTHRFRTR